MASKADRERRRRAKTIKRAAEPKGSPAPAAASQAAKPKAPRQVRAVGPNPTGLDMLRDRGRVTPRQADNGKWYGWLWRNAQIAGGPARIADLSRAGGGTGGDGLPIGDDAEAWLADIRRQLAEVEHDLHGDEDDALLTTMQLICGAGMRPREITSLQRETEQIEAALRVGLDIVGRVRREMALRRRAA